jgi:hypothetical protein
MLDEAVAALDRAGQLLSAYLAGADRVSLGDRMILTVGDSGAVSPQNEKADAQ